MLLSAITVLCLLLLPVTVTATSSFVNDGQPQAHIWPLPKQYTNGSVMVALSPSFTLTSPQQGSDLSAVLSRYQSIIFLHHLPTLSPTSSPSSSPPPKTSSASKRAATAFSTIAAAAAAAAVNWATAAAAAATAAATTTATANGAAVAEAAAAVASLTSLVVTVSNPSAELQLGTDETYNLTIPVPTSTSSVATLSAVTLAGANRGLETFAQLVRFNFTRHQYLIHHAPWQIYDGPLYPHRAILLDTSRHFQPLPTLYLFVDSLAAAKFNTFHWHLSDDPSFPLESFTSPSLWDAAFSEDDRYTQQDVMDVVEYARLRGVRVMTEIDVPGHASSMCKGYPNICPSSVCLTPLDPSQVETFDRLKNLFGELTGNKQGQGLFPENFFHLGGDEVNTSCWSTTPRVSSWLSSQNMTTDDAYMYMVQQAHSTVIGQGRDPVNWDEVWEHFGTKLDQRTIIHNWRDQAFAQQAAAAGYRVIVSNSVWYLDHAYIPWQAIYSVDPLHNIADPAAQAKVIGGEACMWGESVDASDLFNTVWPRAAAAAERLWSPAAATSSTDAAASRLAWFRCYLDSRGYGAAPTHNQLARQQPPGPGACFAQ